MNWLKRILGLRGSWSWACRKLDKGLVICRSTDTGQAKYRLDWEGQRRIMVAYVLEVCLDTEWENAFIFLSDFECTSWAVFDRAPFSGIRLVRDRRIMKSSPPKEPAS